MEDNILSFMDDFAPKSEEDWQALVATTLKGKDFEQTLVRYNEDGVALGPLFSAVPHNIDTMLDTPQAPQLMGRHWHNTPRIDHPDIIHAHKDAMADLQGGASALSLAIDPQGKTGTAVRSKSDISRILDDVLAHLVPISLAPSAHGFANAALLASYFKDKKNLKDIHLSLGYAPRNDQAEKIASLADWVSKNAPHWRAFSVDAARVHNQGATPAQELASMTAMGCAYLRVLLKTQPIEMASQLIDVHLASDQDAHQGIVKFRAARLLWAKLLDSFGAKTKTCPLHASSSVRMLATQDPWANLLRLSSANFGAVCGGADMITILPFTHTLGLATPFARRISRNIGLMHGEETHLGHVADPAHGSYMHEQLTQKLAQKAWEIFQEIEAKGGWFNPGAQNWFKAQTDEARRVRNDKINTGEILLVGVNQFAKPDVRKAKTLPRPTIKTRSGPVIDTDNFADATAQIHAGRLLPLACEDIE